MILLVAMGFLLIILIEVPALVRKKMWRELVVFAAFTGIGLSLSIPLALDLEIANPFEIINAVYGPLGKWLAGP